MATKIIASPAMTRKAQELLAVSDKWATGYRLSDGLRFVVFSSRTTPGTVYYTRMDGAACNCPAARLSRSGRCCHRLAAQLACEQATDAFIASRSQDEYADDLVSLF